MSHDAEFVEAIEDYKAMVVREARAQAYEEIAEQAHRRAAPGLISIALYDFAVWLRTESKRIRESK